MVTMAMVTVKVTVTVVTMAMVTVRPLKRLRA